MQIKLFEVRDRGTFLPCIGIAMYKPANPVEHFLLGRAGYDNSFGTPPCILFGRMRGEEFNYDPYQWPIGTRTMHVAHEYVNSHWNELETGAVVCVESILGERQSPKQSEALEDA